jgi:phosphatidylserine decarboxylase precursor
MDQPIVTDLKALLLEHEKEGAENLLTDSVNEAIELARLKGFKYMDCMPKPGKLYDEGGYFDYLNKSVVLIPREDYPKETFITLWVFYWLLNAPPGQKLQEFDWFNVWMRRFANDWGKFLDTPASAAGIKSFLEDPAYNADQYFPVGHYHTFNDFFAREIKPGLRPVADIMDNKVITSPADSEFKEQWPIDEDNEILVKHTHKYKIAKLLEGSPYAEAFRGGLFYHAFLGPFDYHRFRVPVSGTVKECRAIQEKVYLQTTIDKNGEPQAPDDGGYEFTQTRGLIIQETEEFGPVATLPIGMAQVSSVNMVAQEGAWLTKGEEFGFFMFGGSDIILLLPEAAKAHVTAAPGIHYLCGQQIIKAR